MTVLKQAGGTCVRAEKSRIRRIRALQKPLRIRWRCLPYSSALAEIDNAALVASDARLFVLSQRTASGQRLHHQHLSRQEHTKRIAFAVNKGNLTHDMVMEGRRVQRFVLAKGTSRSLRLRPASGKIRDKFAGFGAFTRSVNGVTYVTRASTRCSAAQGDSTQDCGAHTFSSPTSRAKKLPGAFRHLKSTTARTSSQKPRRKQQKRRAGSARSAVYLEGEVLPAVSSATICKHGRRCSFRWTSVEALVTSRR